MYYVVHGNYGMDRFSIEKTRWYAGKNDSKDGELDEEMAGWWNMD